MSEKKKRPSQEDKVLDYLRRNPFITGDDARDQLHIAHLPKRINNLKAAGFNIVNDMYYYKDEDGTPGHYARYRLHEKVSADA